MDKSDYSQLIKRFSSKRIAVVGDIALDSYVYGSVDRVNPEMPASPLLKVQSIENTLGCAANVALNLANLGANVSLFGSLGADSYQKTILKKCKASNIKTGFVVEGKTLVKQRIKEKAHQGYITRVDYGENELKPISKKNEEAILTMIRKEVPQGIILSDYNKKIFTGKFGSRIIEYAISKNIPVFVDPKPSNIISFKKATLIKTNEKEARQCCPGALDIQQLVNFISDLTQSKYTVITRGSKGMASFDGKYNFAPTLAKQVIDVSGAGDTVISVLTLCIVCGLPLRESMHIANTAAGIVVEKAGTATTNKEELISRLE